MLGDTDYKIYYEYNERSNSRYYVNGFMESLSDNEKLTDDQAKELIEIMYQEQMKVFSEIGYDPTKSIEFPSDVKEGKVEGQKISMGKIHANSVECARDILSTFQLEQFEEYLREQRERMGM